MKLWSWDMMAFTALGVGIDIGSRWLMGARTASYRTEAAVT